MIRILANKGWEKNEIIYEMQRVFGNDVLIHTKLLHDERSWIGKNKFIIGFGLLGFMGFMFHRYRTLRIA